MMQHISKGAADIRSALFVIGMSSANGLIPVKYIPVTKIKCEAKALGDSTASHFSSLLWERKRGGKV